MLQKKRHRKSEALTPTGDHRTWASRYVVSSSKPKRPMHRSEYLSMMVKLSAAEFHWHFTQGFQALDKELYIPGAVCLLSGIEASIRVTMHQIEQPGLPNPEDLGSTFSNSLLQQAYGVGMEIEALQFPGETDFEEKVQTRSNHVKIVQLRHSLAHGNVLGYVNCDLDLFTPECLRDDCSSLKAIAKVWIDEIATYRSSIITT